MPQNPLLGDFPLRGLPFEGRDNWFGRHPRIGRGLDDALIALSNMDEPSPTIGGNISNAARGFLSIGQTRRGLRQQQVADEMAPQMTALGMQKTQGEIDLHRAQADLARTGAEENRAQTALFGRTKVADQWDVSEMISDQGHPYKFNITQGSLKYVGDPALQPTTPPTFQRHFKEKEAAGKTLPERLALMEEEADTLAGKKPWDLKRKAGRINALAQGIQLTIPRWRAEEGYSTPDAAAKHLEAQLGLLKGELKELTDADENWDFDIHEPGEKRSDVKARKGLVKRALGGFVNRFYQHFQQSGQLLSVDDYIQQLQKAPAITPKAATGGAVPQGAPDTSSLSPDDKLIQAIIDQLKKP